MDGLLLRLLHGKAGRPEPSFWKIFDSIRQDLDRLYWCVTDRPWFSGPEDFDESTCVDFPERRQSSIMLWGPGGLSRYADAFTEEQIALWAIEPRSDYPVAVASEYSDADRSGRDAVERRYARVSLDYLDSTYWEIYAREPALLDRLAAGLAGKAWVAVTRGNYDRRGEMFGKAGLSEVWRAMRGNRE
jgi:hypothetical protein